MLDSSNEPKKPRDPRALNAYRHGLTGQVLVFPPAEKVAYEKHCKGIQEALAPKGAMEIGLVQSIADDRWRLHRAAAMETNILAIGLNEPDALISHHEEIDTALAMARIWLEQGKGLQLLTLYESRLQRRVEKNMTLLRQLQQDRRDALQKLVEEAAILGDTFEFPAELLPPQFDFSSRQIARLATHRRGLHEAGTRLQLSPKTYRTVA